jgi:hypothetical protein
MCRLLQPAINGLGRISEKEAVDATVNDRIVDDRRPAQTARDELPAWCAQVWLPIDQGWLSKASEAIGSLYSQVEVFVTPSKFRLFLAAVLNFLRCRMLSSNHDWQQLD